MARPARNCTALNRRNQRPPLNIFDRKKPQNKTKMSQEGMVVKGMALTVLTAICFQQTNKNKKNWANRKRRKETLSFTVRHVSTALKKKKKKVCFHYVTHKAEHLTIHYCCKHGTLNRTKKVKQSKMLSMVELDGLVKQGSLARTN